MTVDVRQEFLATGAVARQLLAEPRVAARWNEPSALAEFSVAGLSGHLSRAVLAVVDYLDASPPPAGAEPVTPAAYFAGVLTDNDLSSPLHAAIRQRGLAAATGGPADLLERLDMGLAGLHDRLRDEPADRLVSVFGGFVLTLDDYLVTRLVELTVHIDDLAVSIGVPTPPFPEQAVALTVGALVDTARRRHGDVALLRALARRERDPGGVVPVL
jgi:uncharacterized protein (TIGR03083 family)